MKRIYKVYKKTVSIVNETPTAMYENLVGSRKGFLLESYDKNYDRYTFLGEPEELISSEGESLVITKKSGEREVRRGNPLALLKEYYDEFEIHKVASKLFWLVLILIYYFIATFLSIDKIIGKIYPLFGICLIIMALGVALGIFTKGYEIPEIWNNFANLHPQGTPIWSFMFITVACGAISGFHATQSPLMARCMKSEKQGHFVFYGAMVSEGIIALIWAAAGCALYTGEELLALGGGGSTAVYDVCSKTMGGVGIALAMLGVIACPITSGDTAFRSARLVLADWFHMEQKSWKNRLILCVPVLGIGAILGIGNALGKIDYTIIWRYFSWTNQTLAMIVLWAASMYLFYDKKNYWITAVPATFMSAVSVTYFLLGNECLGQFLNTKTADGATIYNTAVAYPVGIIAAIVFLGIFLYTIKKRHTQPHYETLHK